MIELLVQRAKENDLAAFEEIIKLYEKKVYNLALRYMKNHDDALDVAQEVFIQVYNNLSMFRGEAQFSTWIYRITYNSCVDMLRKQTKTKKNIAISIDDEKFYETQKDKQLLEEEYEKKETLEFVLKAIDTLPKEQRDVVILRYIKDLSYAQIGEILDIAEGTVKSRLNRARWRIKEIVKLEGTNLTKSQSKQKKIRN